MPTTILDNETYPEALQRRYAEETKAEKQAEIIRMANEACQPHQILNTDLVFLERFFNLAFTAGAAHEREKIEAQLKAIRPQGKSCLPMVLEAVLAERDKALEAAITIGGEFSVEFEKVYLK